MPRPRTLLIACAATMTIAAAPAVSSSGDLGEAPAGASVEDGTFPIGVCAWARPTGYDKTCVIVNDPRPWLP